MDLRLHHISKYLNVKRFYQNLFHHTRSDVPNPVEKQFRRSFHKPVAVEWMMTGEDYEALFYEQQKERIARFDPTGKLLEVRTNISPLDSSLINNLTVKEMGDLMNYIQIKRGEHTTHELIIRKPDQTRMLILLDDNFEIVRQEIL